MAAFELNDVSSQATGIGNASGNRPPVTVAENVICFKIYDSCRQQDCLDFNEIGPARSAETTIIDGHHIKEGEIIIPPHDAVSVSMDNIYVDKIVIVDKCPSCFRKGYWDVDLKYVIEYRLVFRNSDADIIYPIKAKNVCNRKVTLFGSDSCDLQVSTDLFGGNGVFDATPFIMAEAKAMCLSASILYEHCNSGRDLFQNPEDRRAPSVVEVTIGLFSLVKLFRIVDLVVESRGFSIPEECEKTCPINPCEYFETLDFPMDIFAPPQKKEFQAGISSNIPSKGKCACQEAEPFIQASIPEVKENDHDDRHREEPRRSDIWR